MAREQQVEWVHCRNRKEQLGGKCPRNTQLYNPWPPNNQQRDPDTMDTSADRGRMQVAEVGDPNRLELNQRDSHPMHPPFTAREGFLRRQVEHTEMRGVQCYQCQNFGHFACNCFQKQRTQPPSGQTRARGAEGREDAPTSSAEERANQWLKGLGQESNEVKNLVVQTM